MTLAFLTKSGELDMTYIFGLSIFFWVFNRVYSSYKIWEISSLDGITFVEEEIPTQEVRAVSLMEKAEKSRKWRVLRTLFNVEIFEILYTSHTLELKGKSAPQRMLDLNTAVFEAAPEVQSLFSIGKCVCFIYRVCMSGVTC